MKPLVLPQVNLNGTSRDELVRQQLAVLAAFRVLQQAMAEASPNGRDYQLRPAEFKPAQEAWWERMQAVEDMRREIETHAMAIQDGK